MIKFDIYNKGGVFKIDNLNIYYIVLPFLVKDR